MWEQITTLSEIDTVDAGTFLAEKNPAEHTEIIIYRVAGKTEDDITIQPVGDDMRGDTTIKADALFDDAWWMLKEN